MLWSSSLDPTTVISSRAQSSARCALWLLSLVPSVFIVMGGCTSETNVTRVDTNVVTDLSGHWNDTDSRFVAEAMVKEALASHWLDDFTHQRHRPPVVVVGTILNRSYEHIDTETFIMDLERELGNAQAVRFVAARGEREEVREERRDQAVHAQDETQKRPGKELGADYMLGGTISSILDEAAGVKAVFYQVDLELIDVESDTTAWFGQKKIKKVIERKRVVF
jgi:penicillin-binding protein activator